MAIKDKGVLSCMKMFVNDFHIVLNVPQFQRSSSKQNENWPGSIDRTAGILFRRFYSHVWFFCFFTAGENGGEE